MDFAKFMVFRTLILYFPRFSIFPHSTSTVPFGSVTTYEECICIRFGFTKNRVLPEPEPPADHKDIFIAGIFRLFRSARHHQTFRSGQKDIIFKYRIHIWLYIFGISPPCRAVLHSMPEIFCILCLVVYNEF